jgi:hypothetical protein
LLSGISVLAGLVVIVLYFTDQRELLGVPLWEKPLKFLISTVVYAATFSWFSSLVGRGQKIVWWLGTLIAGMLVLELVIIIGLASAGLTSHFNISDGFHITMWTLMATGISALWFLSFGVGAYIWNTQRVGHVVRSGIRWGLVTGLAGMGLAFTMTSPTPQQLANFDGIAGAHTVGLGDGGPGLPFVGWSTVGGDLRVAHFVGLHGLQVLPLIAALITVLVSSAVMKKALVHGVGVTYSLFIAVVYVQALSGESVTQPSSLTLFALAGSIVAGGLTTVTVSLNWSRKQSSPEKLTV